ncbi:MAG: T9SS type A sorting domain-containing protein [Bacteroidota bacterium]
MKTRRSIFLWLLMLGITSVIAQPAKFSFIPTNLSGTVLGQATIAGIPADAADWVAAFDASGNCAGASQVIINGGLAYINLPIYGDDITTPSTDEGMNGGEIFSLMIWDVSANGCFPTVNPCAPTQFSGWSNTNGAPMSGYNSPNTVYDFTPISQPTVTLAPFTDICENDAPLSLSSGSPVGGSYSGTGVAANVFDPQLVGPGTYTLTYIFIDPTCQSDTASETITVLPAPTVVAPSLTSVCLDAVPFILPEGTPAGGSWTGSGIGANNEFDPMLVGAGTVSLGYTVVNGDGCMAADQSSMTVLDIPIVEAGLDVELCLNDAPLQLTFGTPMGGSFTGPGVNADMFDPLVVGVGVFSLEYQFTDTNGCSASDSLDIRVSDVPDVQLDEFLPVCEDQEVFPLMGGSPIGGMYSGGGINGNQFDPATIGAGTHSVLYVFTNTMGCTDSATQPLVVHPIPAKPTITLSGDQLDATVGASAYQWWLNGLSLTDSMNQQIFPSDSGYYQVQITDANGCQSISDSIWFRARVMNLAAFFPDAVVSLYPNPSSGRMYFRAENLPFLENSAINVLDMRGRIILHQPISQGGNYTQTMDLGDHAAGVYLFQLILGGKRIMEDKFLLN